MSDCNITNNRNVCQLEKVLYFKIILKVVTFLFSSVVRPVQAFFLLSFSTLFFQKKAVSYLSLVWFPVERRVCRCEEEMCV